MNRKNIFMFIGSLVIFLFALSFQKAAVQKEEMLRNQNKFNQAQYYSDAQQFQQAKVILDELLQQSQQAPIYYLSAEIEGRLGNSTEAAINMYRVLQLDPHYVDNPKFMLYYLEILIGNNDFERAQHVLQRCLNFHPTKTTAQYKERVYQLLLQVEQRGQTYE